MKKEIQFFCPVCNKPPENVNYYRRILEPLGIISVRGNSSIEQLGEMGKQLEVIHITCRTCKTILTTLGNPDALQTNNSE